MRSNQEARWLAEAQAGDTESMEWLAQTLDERGEFHAGARWYARAANLGSPWAQWKLGWHYQDGLGVRRNLRLAAKWTKLAAEAGDPVAMIRWGYCLGHGLGVRRNMTQSHAWTLKAAKRGRATACFNLSIDFYKGFGVRRNMRLAVSWLRKTIRNESVERHTLADALCDLGWHYRNGSGVKRDRKKAAELYEKAARLGLARAHYNLATQERFENRNRSDIGHLRRAVAKDHPRSHFELGRALLFGVGVRQDVPAGIQYLKLARKLGVGQAKQVLRSKKVRALLKSSRGAVKQQTTN